MAPEDKSKDEVVGVTQGGATQMSDKAVTHIPAGCDNIFATFREQCVNDRRLNGNGSLRC
jgi:hypothetical protein